MERTLNILLVEDDPLCRSALTSILAPLASRVNIAEAGGVTEAWTLIESNTEFDVVLYDWCLPDGGRLHGFIALSQLLPRVPIVVISAREEPEAIRNALSAGAKGYIPKSANGGVIRAAVTLVLGGEQYVPSIALNKLASTSVVGSHDVKLTARQNDVLHLMAKGYANKQIGRALKIADTTVRVHVSEILRQLCAHNRTDAVVKARDLGILEP